MATPGSSIVFVSSLMGAAWGGSEELWSRTAANLARLGFRVYAELPNVANRPAHPRIAELRKAGVHVQWWPTPTVRGLVTGMIYDRAAIRAKLPSRDPEAWFQARLEKLMPALVVFSSGNNDFPAGLTRHCRALNIPYALIAHAVYEYNWPGDDRAAEMRDYYEHAAAQYFVSRENREATRLMTGLEGREFEVIRSPINVSREADPPWPADDGGYRLAFVGRIEPGTKGCDLILRALAAKAWKERPVELHFYGQGPAEKGVQRMAELLGLKNCFFHGHVGDVAEIWRQNHLLVLPSRYEGLPLVIIEAMMCGRPCLVTDVAGNAELLEDGVSGFVAAGPTVQGVAAALERAWQQRAQWPQMGRAAAAAVRVQFPADPVAEFTERLLKLAARNRPPAH